ncbi:MAG: RNA polymerase sigma factor [Patescibacteria group bacterium]
MELKSDEELVVAVKEGSVWAFEVLVKRYQNRLFNFCVRIVIDRALAEELVQDALFKIYTTIGRIDTSRRFSIYAFEIVKNMGLSALRRQKREVSLEEVVGIGEDAAFYEQLAQKEEMARVRRVVARLRKEYQEVIRLYYFEDLSYKEIGKRLQIPLNTVRTHLRRAREALRQELENEIS